MPTQGDPSGVPFPAHLIMGLWRQRSGKQVKRSRNTRQKVLGSNAPGGQEVSRCPADEQVSSCPGDEQVSSCPGDEQVSYEAVDLTGLKECLERMPLSDHCCWVCSEYFQRKLQVCGRCRTTRFCSDHCASVAWAANYNDTCRCLRQVFIPEVRSRMRELRLKVSKTAASHWSMHDALFTMAVWTE